MCFIVYLWKHHQQPLPVLMLCSSGNTVIQRLILHSFYCEHRQDRVGIRFVRIEVTIRLRGAHTLDIVPTLLQLLTPDAFE